jgi:hypothetical protein
MVADSVVWAKLHTQRRRGDRQKCNLVGSEPRTSVYDGCNGAKPALDTADLFCEFGMGRGLEMVSFWPIPLGALA